MGRRDASPSGTPEAPVARVAVVSADAGLSVAMSRLLPDHELHPFGNAAHVAASSMEYDAAVVAVGTTAAGLETVGRLPMPARRCLVIGDDVPAGRPNGPRIVRAPVRMDAMVAIVRELTGPAPDVTDQPDVPSRSDPPAETAAEPRASAPAAPAARPRVDLRPRPWAGDNGRPRPDDDYERDLVYETEIGPPTDAEPRPEGHPGQQPPPTTAQESPAGPGPEQDAGSEPEPEPDAAIEPARRPEMMPGTEREPEAAAELPPPPEPAAEPEPKPAPEPAPPESATAAEPTRQPLVGAEPDGDAEIGDEAGFEIAGDDDEPAASVAVRFWPRSAGGPNRGFGGGFDPGQDVLDEALRALGGEVAALWRRAPDEAFDVVAARGLGTLERRAWLPVSHPLFELLDEAEAVRLLAGEDTGQLLCGVSGHGGGRCVALALRDGTRLAAVVVVGGAGASDGAVERLLYASG